MAKKITSFAQLKVSVDPLDTDRQPLVLTFLDTDMMHATARELRREGFTILDESPRYEMFRDVESAMKTARVFCRK